MKTIQIPKIIRASIAALVAILLFISAGLRIPLLDSTTDDYFREAITKAGVAYATCRLINASVSIVKDSSLNLEPAGVGVTLAVGQALDPIDDMTERVSDVLVTAITSLGVQKLAFEIGVSIAPPILAIFLMIFFILSWFENERLAAIQKTIMRIILLVFIARFALPISALANNYLQEHFFADNISNANKELAVGTAELDKLMDFSLPEIDGLLGTIKNNTSFIQRKSMEFKDAIVATVSNAGSIVDNLLKLTFLYVGVFLIQVIALPIMVFWSLVKFANSLFDTNSPVMLHHSRVSKNEIVSTSNPANG
ncbi:MAG: hypothetical protein KKB91_02095 [Proteobacteria bacterium]|nr:hypothetical protein [Desulfocapsa sp.]MBU3945837.1 hypothetical protein [Pseudomonadota bacterium]MCG2743360.1 hypothetical protein [Desulfobacteraceae bacterium]MBU3983301.1 hypothetical protein [Pseudomonadota bacterium]MBU4030129.1 hypothetical protein [Pseudomonadota bacterium]